MRRHHPLGRFEVAREGPERERNRDAVIGTLHDLDRVTRADDAAGDHGQVGAGATHLGEAAQPALLAHAVPERRARDPRAGHLEHDLGTDRPPVTDQAVVDGEAGRGQILPERPAREGSTELLLPPVELLPGERIDRLPVAAVVPCVTDEVALESAPQASVLGARGSEHGRRHRALVDPGDLDVLGRVRLACPEVEGEHGRRHGFQPREPGFETGAARPPRPAGSIPPLQDCRP